MSDTRAAEDEAGMRMPDHLIRHATLRQLQVFAAIVRHGSFTRAAEELFLTQPTVSMQIKKLSESVGLTLFEQVGRRVRPTEAGRDLYEACRAIFDTLSDLESKIAARKGMRRGRLRLAVITTAKYFAPQVLGEFCAQYPGIEASLKVTNRDRVIERILGNEDDLYIMGQQPDEVAVECYPFAPNPLIVVAGREHPLVGECDIPLARVAEEPFLIREPGSGTRDAVLRLMGKQGLKPRIRMELGSNEAIKHALVGGLGVSVLSLHTLTLEGLDGPIAMLDVQGFPVLRQWSLVHPRNKDLTLPARAFLDYVLESQERVRARLQSLLPELPLDELPPG
jgi:DNA-binding transcriptional LysR family regulator